MPNSSNVQPCNTRKFGKSDVGISHFEKSNLEFWFIIICTNVNACRLVFVPRQIGLTLSRTNVAYTCKRMQVPKFSKWRFSAKWGLCASAPYWHWDTKWLKSGGKNFNYWEGDRALSLYKRLMYFFLLLKIHRKLNSLNFVMKLVSN